MSRLASLVGRLTNAAAFLAMLSLSVLCPALSAQASPVTAPMCVPTMTPEQAYLAIRGKPARIATAQTDARVRATMANLINLNSASEAQLTELDGIGAKKAQDIILYRETMGHFGNVDELSKVKGIGQATVDKNRHRITVR